MTSVSGFGFFASPRTVKPSISPPSLEVGNDNINLFIAENLQSRLCRCKTAIAFSQKFFSSASTIPSA